MQRISVNIICRKDRTVNDLQPLYCRLIIDRCKVDMRIAHMINPANLLPNGSVKQSLFNSFSINNDIQNVLTEVNKIITFHRLNDIVITKNSFTELYRKKIDTTSLYTYIITECKQMAISLNRYHSYISLANHILKKFPKIKLNDCNYNFLVSLEKYFIYELNFKQNTVSSNFNKLRAVLSVAFKRKLIKENPFLHYKIKGFTSSREFLSKNEVLSIEKIFTNSSNKHEKNVCAIFLFLCYTGLRIGDFTKLKFEDIKNGCIEHTTNKTKTKNIIPLSKPALRFIENDSFVFYKISSEKINKSLKNIAIKANIEKPLSCHVARHTFATLCLELNMNITTISKILGHSKLSTTMIYAKVLNETKKKEILKWDTFFG